MRIQYMSDLHLEFCDNSMWLKHNELPVTGDVLVLAGDIFYLKNRIAPLFWKWASANYRQVLIVPGNHEYYNYCDVMDNGLEWNWIFKNNVGYYQNQIVRIDDTDFIMSTLWSQISPSDEYFVWKDMNDFRQIIYNGKLLQTEEFNQMHNFCLDFIKRSLAESTAEHIVVVTHHLPTLEVVAPQRMDLRAFTHKLMLKLMGQKSFAIRWGMYLTTNISAMALIRASVLFCNK